MSDDPQITNTVIAWSHLQSAACLCGLLLLILCLVAGMALQRVNSLTNALYDMRASCLAETGLPAASAAQAGDGNGR